MVTWVWKSPVMGIRPVYSRNSEPVVFIVELIDYE